jgi:hypothetical protein
MNRKTHTSRRIVSALALIGSVAAIAVPTASAGNQNDPGIVPSKLGSQDPRDTVGKALFSPSIVASRLGSQDPRDTAVAELNQPSLVARQLGSPDARDSLAESNTFGVAAQEHGAAGFGNVDMGSDGLYQASLVARQIGSPDARDSLADGNTFGIAAQEHGASGFGNVNMGSDGLYQPSLVAMKIGSQDSRDTVAENVPESSVVATELGSPDTRDAGLQNEGDYMFRDYFRGTHFTNDGSSLVARQLGSPDIRDAAQTRGESAMLTDLSGMHWASPLTEAPVVASRQVTSAQIERSVAVNNLLHHTIQPAPVDTQVTSDNGVNWGKVGIGIAVAVCGLLLLGALGIGTRQIRHGGQRLGRA